MHPLQSAIELGSTDIAELLTEYKDSINDPIASTGRRALHCAVLTKNTTIIAEILKLGADWNAVDDDEATPLHLLFQRSEKSVIQQKKIVEVLKVFFENNVEINVKTPKDQTLLFLAVKYYLKDVAKFLIEQGADLNTSDNEGNTLAHILVKNAIEIQHLQRRATTSSASYSPDRRVVKGEAAEQSRKKWKDADFLDELLLKGVDANRKNKADELPFQLALQYELLPMLPVLIRHTRDLQMINNSNGLILHSVLKMLEVKEKNTDFILDSSDDDEDVFQPIAFEPRIDFQIETIVKMLRDRGLSTVDVDENGDTPLIIAAKLQKYDIVEALLSRPTNVNVSDRHGNTALHYFASGDLRNKLEVLRKLVSQGTDLYKLNNEGHSPIHVAARCKNRIALRFFAEVQADFTKRAGNGDTVVHLMARNSYSTTDNCVIDLLMSQDCKVNVLNDEGLTPLIVALQYCNADVLPVLIKKGANVNFQHHSTGWTPLHFAVQLMCNAADTDVQKMFARSLDLNCQYPALNRSRTKILSQIVATLLRAYAKVDVEDNEGRSPMFYCLKNNCEETVTLMLQYGADFSEVSELSGRVKEYRKSKSFVEYLTKLRVAGFSTSKLAKNSGISAEQQNTKLVDQCLNEVRKMKETVLLRSGKTVHEFACMSLNEKVRWVPTVYWDLVYECEENFPIYRDILLGMGYEANTTKFLRRKGKEAFMKLTRYTLPDITVEQIVMNLSNRSLRRMLAATTVTKRKRRSTSMVGGVDRRRRVE